MANDVIQNTFGSAIDTFFGTPETRKMAKGAMTAIAENPTAQNVFQQGRNAFHKFIPNDAVRGFVKE